MSSIAVIASKESISGSGEGITLGSDRSIYTPVKQVVT